MLYSTYSIKRKLRALITKKLELKPKLKFKTIPSEQNEKTLKTKLNRKRFFFYKNDI